jgi:hypothetical protein
LLRIGWSLGPATLLGFTHFRHLDSKPPGYAYPYPDFCWLVFAAEAARFVPDAKLDDGYETGSEFYSFRAARALPLPPCQQVYLEAAVRLGESLRQQALGF